MRTFDHSSRSAFVKSDTDVGREGLAVSSLIHPKGLLSGWGQASHTKLAYPCIYGPYFVHWYVVMLE